MRFAVVGDPVAHSLSPKMHTAAYEALGLDHSYEAIQVPLATADAEFERLYQEGFAGINITVPLKETAYRWSVPDQFATQAQAVNTIDMASRAGINTDGPGFVRVLQDRQRSADSSRVLLLGAGGSSRAIALALQQARFSVTIWNRTRERARELATSCGCEFADWPTVSDFDVVVNATSASMRGELPEVLHEQPLSESRTDAIAIDLYYSSQPTVFMDYFDKLQWRTLDGRELLVAQGALSFEFWLSIPAPVEAMRAAVGL